VLVGFELNGIAMNVGFHSSFHFGRVTSRHRQKGGFTENYASLLKIPDFKNILNDQKMQENDILLVDLFNNINKINFLNIITAKLNASLY